VILTLAGMLGKFFSECDSKMLLLYIFTSKRWKSSKNYYTKLFWHSVIICFIKVLHWSVLIL